MDGIYRLMHSDLEGPANIGDPEYVTVKELVELVAEVSGKRINVAWVKGPVGELSRNLRQQTDLLARLACAGTDQTGDRADASVDRGTGEEGAGGAVALFGPDSLRLS